MKYLLQDQPLQDSCGMSLGYGIVTIFMGAVLVLWPSDTFEYLVTVLPWGVLIWGIVKAILSWRKKIDYGPTVATKILRGARHWGMAGALLILATVLFIRQDWGDKVLWYFFVAWVVLTVVKTLKPIFSMGLKRKFIWRIAGSVAALFFVALMLLSPRSGLSDALQLLGCFALAWGLFQLAMPRPKD